MASAFSDLDAATLTDLRNTYVEAIKKVALNQAYTLNGRSVTRANLKDLKETLAELSAAILEAGDTAPSETRVNFTGI